MGAVLSSDSFRELRSEVHGHISAFEERGYGWRRLETKSIPDLGPIKNAHPIPTEWTFHKLFQQIPDGALPRSIPPDPRQLLR